LLSFVITGSSRGEVNHLSRGSNVIRLERATFSNQRLKKLIEISNVVVSIKKSCLFVEGKLNVNRVSHKKLLAKAGAKENELNKDDRLCPSSLNCNTLTARCQAQIKPLSALSQRGSTQPKN